jgi:hypothetical protein
MDEAVAMVRLVAGIDRDGMDHPHFEEWDGPQ